MKNIRRISIEYEDGGRKELEADEIDENVLSALGNTGLSSPPLIPEAESYLVLEWKDVWREVVSIKSNAAELLRYYVISRIEDRGRLVLDIGGDYPELEIIERLPAELARLLLVDEKGSRAYLLDREIEGYEGTFEAGGKKEFTRYDRDNPEFQRQVQELPEIIGDIEKSVARALREKDLSPEALLAMDEEQQAAECLDIASRAGIHGMKSRADVRGFTRKIIKIIAG